MNQAVFYLRLSRLPDVGPVGVRRIFARLQTLQIDPYDIFNLDEEILISELQMTFEQINELRNPARNAETDLEECSRMGINVILQNDSSYPHRAADYMLQSAPLMLFSRGNLDLLKLPAIGVSGARKASEGSLMAISNLCSQTADDGWVIVSGGAVGVDEVAHLAGIRKGPGTIVVQPTGMLRPNYRGEFSRHLESGRSLVISEFPPERPWMPGCAMQRNRLLSALSKVTLLVEPKAKSGTIITGRAALKMKLPVYILDSENLDEPAVNLLIKKGAQRLTPHGWKTGELTQLFMLAIQSSEQSRQEGTKQSPLPL
jgi:DNA processing protein